ncbi:MAG: hydrogenase formation protein HypD [Selenomonadaceae bacterium]|nr:hydrogenase formation protein HypD [Selenomonadaceae bacterium]
MFNALVKKIEQLAEGKRPLRFMEVCGTHTVSIFRAGIRQILPPNVELVSGPGCPVCVTCDEYVDRAIVYAQMPDVIIATFGDMLKVTGTYANLAEISAAGADIRVIYSPLDCIKIAKENPDKHVIFLAVGFETTAPTTAATILTAKSQGVRNLFFLSAQKLVPPALEMLLNDSEVRVDGFLLPGHVAVVIGVNAFKFLKIPSVVAGFEAEEILLALINLLTQIDEGRAEVTNEYKSVVKPEGNLTAQKMLSQVFCTVDAEWRGIGEISQSGLALNEEFADFDAEKVLPVNVPKINRRTPCRCGEILRGIVTPKDCPLFGKVCDPIHAVGPCMVSVEGICAAWYRFSF